MATYNTETESHMDHLNVAYAPFFSWLHLQFGFCFISHPGVAVLPLMNTRLE